MKIRFVVFVVVIIVLIKWIFYFWAILVSAIIYYVMNLKYKNVIKKDITVETINKKKQSKLRQIVLNVVQGITLISGEVVGNIPSHIVRDIIYKYLFHIKMNGAHIYKGVQFRDGFRCKIGKGTIIGDHSIIDARGGVVIGENVNFSSEVRVWTGQHKVNDSWFAYESASVTVGNRAWISSNVIILPGSNIGEGAVICAGAVVTKDCEPYGIYAGVPAKKIGTRAQDLKYEFDKGTICWWW